MQKLHIWYKYACMSLVYARQILGQYDLYLSSYLSGNATHVGSGQLLATSVLANELTSEHIQW